MDKDSLFSSFDLLFIRKFVGYQDSIENCDRKIDDDDITILGSIGMASADNNQEYEALD